MNVKKNLFRLINAWIKRGYWFNEVQFRDCRKFWQYKTFNTEVANLGSTSACYAFNYEGLSIKGANWALFQNPLLGDQAILKNYYSYLKPEGSTVILSLCVFSSLAGSYDISEDRYYSLLYPTSIPHFSYRNQQRVKTILQNPVRYYPMYALLSDLKHFLFKKRCVEMSEEQMEADADSWMNGWLREFSLSDFSSTLSLIHNDSINDAVEILNQIIIFCKARHIRPVIVVPPMYHTLAQKITSEARQTLLGALLEKLIDKDVDFLNYIDDTDFTHNRALFRNSFFLNEKGGRLFTRKVLADIGIC